MKPFAHPLRPLAALLALAALISRAAASDDATSAPVAPVAPPRPAAQPAPRAGRGSAPAFATPIQWRTAEDMNSYFVKQFIASANFGGARMVAQPMVVDDSMRLLPNDVPSSENLSATQPAPAAYMIENLELIGIAKHETPVAFVVNRHILGNSAQRSPNLTTRPLTTFETKALAELHPGVDVAEQTEKDGLLIVGAVRAQDACLRCHTSSKVGDALGAFSYRLKPASLTIPRPALRTPASAPAAPLTTAAITIPPAPKSAPSEKDGLALSIEPIREVITPHEPLVIKATFTNVSSDTFSLPNNLAFYGDWILQLREVNTGKTFTLGYYLQGTPTMSAAPSAPLAPGQSVTAPAAYYRRMSMVEGTLDYDAFQKAITPPPTIPSNVSPPPLPTGTFQATLIVRFPNPVDSGNNAPTFWKGTLITSNPVQFKIGDYPAEQAGAISGMVVDRYGNPAPNTIIGLHYETEESIAGPPVWGSGYATNIARRATPLPPVPIRPTGTYPKGAPVGKTDENGTFAIHGLPPGTYIITADLVPADIMHAAESGSKQPITVTAGAETKLAAPVIVGVGPGPAGN